MWRSLAVLTLGLALSAAGVAADDPGKAGKPAVEVVSLTVTRGVEGKGFAFPQAPSTGLTALVQVPGKQILVLGTDSEVTSFRDDKDTDLTKLRFGKLSFFAATFSKDRSSLLVNLNSFGNAPARGANKLTLKGKLVLACGKDEKKSEEKEVEMKQKATAKVGDFTLRVTSEKSFTGGPSFIIQSPTPAIKSVSCKDADGKPVEVRAGFGTNLFYNAVDKAWTASFSLTRPVKSVKATISYYATVENVTVPVDLTVSLGL
jgi:hypothetical protein